MKRTLPALFLILIFFAADYAASSCSIFGIYQPKMEETE